VGLDDKWLISAFNLTIHLKSVGLKEFLVAVSVTAVVAHVDRGHLGDVEWAVISKVLPARDKGEERETEKKKISRRDSERTGGLFATVMSESSWSWKWTISIWNATRPRGAKHDKMSMLQKSQAMKHFFFFQKKTQRPLM